jgi:hypothetical protein
VGRRERLGIMLRIFTEMIDDGVDPMAALKAFNGVGAWQNAYSNKQRLQQAVMQQRGMADVAEMES